MLMINNRFQDLFTCQYKLLTAISFSFLNSHLSTITFTSNSFPSTYFFFFFSSPSGVGGSFLLIFFHDETNDKKNLLSRFLYRDYNLNQQNHIRELQKG